MSSGKVIAISAREAKLKRRVRAHLKSLGFTRAPDGSLVAPSLEKYVYRQFHEVQREEKLASNALWLREHASELIVHFARGDEVDPESIRPELELITKQTWQSDLFRIASLYWRVPVSDGYGRRMRFLVWDRNNQRLLGLIALGDAVFNQAARDHVIGWDHHRRSTALVNLMDAYVLGAVPPYNMILGGKLVASMIRTKEIVSAFDKKYRNSIGIISGKSKHARLVAVTTSSALGRSSVYNRVSLDGRKILEPIGYTSGWGHFHFSGQIFDELREYLESLGDAYSNGFGYGAGPNWKIRVIRRALDRLGLDTSLARHGFKREVFLCRIAENAIPFLRGDHKRVHYENLPTVARIAQVAKDRWLVPRAAWDNRYTAWEPKELLSQVEQKSNMPRSIRSDRNGLGV